MAGDDGNLGRQSVCLFRDRTRLARARVTTTTTTRVLVVMCPRMCGHLGRVRCPCMDGHLCPPVLHLGRGAHWRAPPVFLASADMVLRRVKIGVVEVQNYAVCVTRMGTRTGEVASLHISSIDQTHERPLNGRTAAAKFFGDRALAQETPSELIRVHPEETHDLKVAPLQTRVCDRPRRNDRIAAVVGHAAVSLSCLASES